MTITNQLQSISALRKYSLLGGWDRCAFSISIGNLCLSSEKSQDFKDRQAGLSTSKTDATQFS